MPSVDLADLRKQNVARAERWHSEGEPWSLADWSNAMCGEAGEAANVVKKIRRHETGLGEVSYNTPDMVRLHAALAEELADLVIYADLVADQADIDLSEAIREKFNRVSEAQDFPERI